MKNAFIEILNSKYGELWAWCLFMLQVKWLWEEVPKLMENLKNIYDKTK